MAPATHRHERRARLVVADEGHEATVGRQRRVDLGRDHCLDPRTQLVVAHQALDHRQEWLVGVADHEARTLVVVERRSLEQFEAVGRDDHLQGQVAVAVRADLVGERRLGDHVEAEVVLEVGTRLADDLEPQPQLAGIGLGVAQPAQGRKGGRGDGDDGTDGFGGEGTHV